MRIYAGWRWLWWHARRAHFARLEQAYPIHLAGVRKHVMDHLAALDLSAFAEAMSGIAAAEMGPPIRRTTPASSA